MSSRTLLWWRKIAGPQEVGAPAARTCARSAEARREIINLEKKEEKKKAKGGDTRNTEH